ncbi:MAG TPA: CPBP family intramembrane glutamic endopeptidase [Propionibacteriaceae bacterium]|nr:CPBP family intramembrane glutamic endopeptidase [Propionibacteriaceae bacterium]
MIVAGGEVLLASAAVLVDLWVPTLVLLALASASLLIRRVGPGSLGLHRPARARRMVIEVLGLSIAWTLLTLALLMPMAEHLTGQRRDVSQFSAVQGNVGLLLFLLLMSWTLAALGEEVAYRGYLHTRIREVLPEGRSGLVLAVALTSALFGFAHTEQGVVGVLLATSDAIFFSMLRCRYRTVWASVLAHGLLNTIGIVAYFVAGPFYGLW